MISLEEKIVGSIVGSALGDALGSPLEKLSHDQIMQYYGKVDRLGVKKIRETPTIPKKGNGYITDDTLMALKICEIYSEKKEHLDAYDIFKLIDKIYYEKTWIPEFQTNSPLIERLFYSEKYIFLSNYLANRDPRSAGIGNMVNCGAMMYCGPIGLVNACDPFSAYKEAISFASAHQWSYGLEAAGVFAAAVSAATIPDITVDKIIEIAIDLANDGTKMAISTLLKATREMDPIQDNANELCQIVSNFTGINNEFLRPHEILGNPSESYAPSRKKSIEELPVALAYINIYKNEPYKALIEGINYGRDSDSIGATIGAIIGAQHGINIFPQNMLKELQEINAYNFIEIAKQFYQIVIKIQKKDFELLNLVQEMRRTLKEVKYHDSE